MGFFFKAEQANIVAYITNPKKDVSPPRITKGDLYSFIGSIAHSNYGDSPSLISRNKPWIDMMSSRAERELRNLDPSDEFMERSRTAESLDFLREDFRHYKLYALVLDNGKSPDSSDELKSIAKQLAYTGGVDILVLFPEKAITTLEVLDPIPTFAIALDSPNLWPGILFWNQFGDAVVVSLNQLSDFQRNLQGELNDHNIERIFQQARESQARSKRILHLSDLHFGNKQATRNQPLLTAELSDVVKRVERVVITGDLFDSPKEEFADQYRAFENTITLLAGNQPIIIPGNHDIRVRGNFGDFYRYVAQQGMQSAVHDPNMGVIFGCFNSSEGGFSARGAISDRQFVQVGTAIQVIKAKNPEASKHLIVALVHHHPFSFETQPMTMTLYEKILARIGINSEKFLKMENSDQFLDWCARWKTSVVLHGHKHVARHMSSRIAPQGATPFQVTAIGCGSSLGAEGSPLSYVILTWDDASQRWVSSFYESCNGGPFIRQMITTSLIGE